MSDNENNTSGDRKASVGSDRKSSVDSDRKPSIDAGRKDSIGGDRKSSIGGDRKSSIGGDRKSSIGGDRKLSVGGDRKSSIGGDRKSSFSTERKDSIGCSEETKYVVTTERCGDITVYVQGDLSQQGKRAVFLTVHDLGCNHTSFHDFVNHPCMCEIKDRSVFIHIDVPGHEDNAPNLPESFVFPSLQQLGEDLVTILDFLHVKYVIGIGEGAGANVLARFGLAHSSRALGLILINCTGSAASVLENFKNKFVNWKGETSVSQSAEDYLIYHKFGHQLVNDTNPDKEKVMQEFQARLRGTINSKNLKQYVNAFLARKDLPLKNCKTDVLLITGMLSSYASVVEKLHRELDKTKATLLKVERAGDVLLEAPYKVAQSILLFCKGQGLLTSLTLPGVDRQRASLGGSFDADGRPRRMSRGMSMEEYDKPNIRRLSITITNDSVPNKHN